MLYAMLHASDQMIIIMYINNIFIYFLFSYRTLKRRLRNLDLKKVGKWSLDEIIPFYPGKIE